MTTKTTRPLFEHVTCSRCAGSGFTLTKAGTVRAIAAKAALFSALEISLARPTE